jgi:hypothetical protein
MRYIDLYITSILGTLHLLSTIAIASPCTSILEDMCRLGFCTLAVTFAVASSVSHSATVTIDAGKDTTIFQSSSTNSGGGSAGIFSGTNGMGSRRRGLIAFDIAQNIPTGSLITSVELHMYLGSQPNESSQMIRLHKLSRDWGEGSAGSGHVTISQSGQGFPASDGDATWSHAMLGSVEWADAGAAGDFEATPSAAATVNTPIDTPVTWLSTAALVNDVQDWLDAPETNFGWALVNANELEIRTHKAFYSSEATQDSSGLPNSLDPSWRPRLVVEYDVQQNPDGDFNADGLVDAADYVVWRKGIAAGNYETWRAQFGETPGASNGGSISIPEPTWATLAASVCASMLPRRRRSSGRP